MRKKKLPDLVHILYSLYSVLLEHLVEPESHKMPEKELINLGINLFQFA